METDEVRNKTDRNRTMQVIEIPTARQAVERLGVIVAPQSNKKGRDRDVRRLTGIADHRVKKIRLGILEAREREYRAILHALFAEIQGLERRSERNRAELRRIAEILEPRRAGGAGSDSGGAG